MKCEHFECFIDDIKIEVINFDGFKCNPLSFFLNLDSLFVVCGIGKCLTEW